MGIQVGGRLLVVLVLLDCSTTWRQNSALLVFVLLLYLLVSCTSGLYLVYFIPSVRDAMDLVVYSSCLHCLTVRRYPVIMVVCSFSLCSYVLYLVSYQYLVPSIPSARHALDLQVVGRRLLVVLVLLDCSTTWRQNSALLVFVLLLYLVSCTSGLYLVYFIPSVRDAMDLVVYSSC